MKIWISVMCIIFSAGMAHAQFGIGGTAGIDLYQYYTKPALTGTDYEKYGAGSAVFNFNIGPKIWLGTPKFSVSVDAQVSYAPFAFDIQDYKGLGAVSFPMGVDINIGGISGFNPLVNDGFSIGGGISFFRSELYFVEDAFLEVQPSGFDRGYFGRIAYGLGAGGLSARLVGRYDYYGEGQSFGSLGLTIDMNLIESKYEVDQDELYSK